MPVVVLALLLLGCGPASSVSGDADADADVLDETRGCTSASGCAVGVDYRTIADCAEPSPCSLSFIVSEPCITALGEVPATSCAECVVTDESGRGGRLSPGRQWVVDCVDGLCTAADEPCSSCPPEAACSTSLDCFLTYFCLTGSCTTGCDTGFDCRLDQVCVREPPDATYGRCVLSG